MSFGLGGRDAAKCGTGGGLDIRLDLFEDRDTIECLGIGLKHAAQRLTEGKTQLGPNIEFADSLIVNSVKLYEVYFIESNGLMYYLQKDKGLVGFELDDNFWMLVD